jgi:pimeloyl-ACP methyl ester carboxylesterase
MSLCAGILGVAGVFIRSGMGSLLLPLTAVAAIVLLTQLALRGLGMLFKRKWNAAKWAVHVCSILLAVLTVLLSVCGLVYAIQDRILFYNVDDPESRAFLRGKPGYAEVEFAAENGKTYHGMLYRAVNGKAPLVIYFGGNGEVSYRRLRGLEEDERWDYYAGYHYLYIDYEGYGLNEGQAGQRSMYEEAMAVYDYAAALPDVDTSRIVTMGYSMGTGSAVYLALSRPVAGLILAAPYANGTELYNNMLPIFYGPFQWLVKQKLPSDKYAPDVTCPALVIASRSDEMVSFASSERLSKLFQGQVDFMELDNAAHNDVFAAEGVYDRVKSFLEEAASK